MSSTTGFVLKQETTTPLVETMTGVTGYPFGGEYYPYQSQVVKTTGCGVGCTGGVVVPTTTTVVESTTTTPFNTYKYVVDVLNVAEDSYLTGHQIDGRVLYPTTGYLYLVWKSLAKLNGFTSVEQMPITFENVEIHRATILALQQQIPTKQIEFCVRIVPKTGVFELVEGENVIVTGRVSVHESIAKLEQLKMLVHQHLTQLNERKRIVDLLEQEEIYRELRMRGYEYKGEFQPLLRADLEGTCGELLWTGKWIPFLDAMLQLNTLQQRRTVGSGLVLPTRIRMIRIDPFAHYHMQKLITKMVKSVSLPTFRTVVGGVERPYVLPVVYEPISSRIVCGGVEIVGVNTTGVQSWTPIMTSPMVTPVVERVERNGVFVPQSFVPYVEKHFDEEYVIVDKLGESEPVFRQNREFLEFYLNECKRYVSHILRKIEQPTIVSTIVPTVVPRSLEQQLEGLKIVVPTTTTTVIPSTVYGGEFLGTPYGKLLESGKLLQLLTHVANIDSTDGQYLYKIQKIFAEKFAYLKALEEDVILNLVNNRSYYLKSILDTVLENTHHIYNMGGVVPRATTETYIPRLKVLEISPSVGHFFGAKVSNLMRLYPNRIGQIDYHYVPSMVGVHPTTVVPEEYIMELNKQLPYEIKKVEWNFGLKNGRLITEVPSHLREYDLVILNGGLSSLLPYVESEYELKKWLQTVVMEKVLKPQGFLFVHEYTNSFDLLSQLNKLEQSVVLTTPSMLSSQMVTPFKFTTGRFPYQKYQSEMQWRQLIEECGFYPVSMKSDVELSSMFLYRRPLSVTMPVCEEKILIDEYVAEQSREWIKRVRCALLEKQIERVWLMSEREPTVEIVSLINQLRREIGGEKIRCLFVADRQPLNVYGTRFVVPSINEFVQMPVVNSTTTVAGELFNVVRKADLIMNVFRQGQWGSFRPIVNLRGVYPITTGTTTTTGVYPFVTGSTFPYPTLSTFERRFVGEKPWTTPMTHLPVGYPFEVVVEGTTTTTGVPTTIQTVVPTSRFVERETVVPTTRFVERETVVPTTRFVERETVVPSCFEREFVEPVVFPSTQVRSVVYRRQQQLTTTTSSQQVLTTMPSQRVLLNPLQTYIITCGLGAFGLELLEWAVEHGARRVILTSKYGVRTGYQARKLRILRDEFNAQIQVLQVDVREEVECMNLIKEAIQMSVEQKIGGIFHLASTIEDILFEQQQYPVHEILKQIAEYRYQGAYTLDKLTRGEGIMDEMSYFVVFSPVLTNTVVPTVVEKICESRRRVGKHGLALHWGCNVNTGIQVEKMFAYDNVIEPTHVVPSRIFNCLRILENLLVKSVEPTMWSHYVPVEKYWLPEVVNTTPYQTQYLQTPYVQTPFVQTPFVQTPYVQTPYVQTGVQQYKSLVEVLLTVLGIRDINRIYGCESTVTLGELGLDTVLAHELKQLFEQVYQFPVQIREIPQMTVEKIRMIESRYPQGINELYLPRPLTYLPRLRSVIRKTIF